MVEIPQAVQDHLRELAAAGSKITLDEAIEAKQTGQPIVVSEGTLVVLLDESINRLIQLQADLQQARQTLAMIKDQFDVISAKAQEKA